MTPRIADLGQPFEDRPEPKPAPRVTMTVFGGVFVVSKAHTRRPRILRLEPSPSRPRKARGGGQS